jgi:hypothetical protein
MYLDSLHHHRKNLAGKAMKIMVAIPNSLVSIMGMTPKQDMVTFQHKETTHKMVSPQAMSQVEALLMIEAGQHLWVTVDMVVCNKVEVDLMEQMGMLGVVEVQ